MQPCASELPNLQCEVFRAISFAADINCTLYTAVWLTISVCRWQAGQQARFAPNFHCRLRVAHAADCLLHDSSPPCATSSKTVGRPASSEGLGSTFQAASRHHGQPDQADPRHCSTLQPSPLGSCTSRQAQTAFAQVSAAGPGAELGSADARETVSSRGGAKARGVVPAVTAGRRARKRPNASAAAGWFPVVLCQELAIADRGVRCESLWSPWLN